MREAGSPQSVSSAYDRQTLRVSRWQIWGSVSQDTQASGEELLQPHAARREHRRWAWKVLAFRAERDGGTGSVGPWLPLGLVRLLACLCHFFFRINFGLKSLKEGFVPLTLALGEKKIRGKSDMCNVERNQ